MRATLRPFQLRAGCAGIHVAHSHHGHAEHQFGNGVGVLAGSVFRAHAVGGGCGEVNVVVTGAGAHYYFELRGGVEHFGIHNVGAHYECRGVGHSLEELRFLGIFFE